MDIYDIPTCANMFLRYLEFYNTDWDCSAQTTMLKNALVEEDVDPKTVKRQAAFTYLGKSVTLRRKFIVILNVFQRINCMRGWLKSRGVYLKMRNKMAERIDNFLTEVRVTLLTFVLVRKR